AGERRPCTCGSVRRLAEYWLFAFSRLSCRAEKFHAPAMKIPCARGQGIRTNALESQRDFTPNIVKPTRNCESSLPNSLQREIGPLHRLPDPRIQPENPRRVEPENIAFRLLGQERQVDDLARQVEVVVGPVRREQQLRFGVDHLQCDLQRL